MEIIKLGSDDAVKTPPRSNEQKIKKSFDGLKITSLKQGARNPNRVNVFVNNKFSFSLDVSQVVDYKIKAGQEITEERLNELKNASTFGKLYQRALEWALIRPRSIRETRDYLRRKLKSVLRGPYATNGERNERVSPVTTGASERVREEHFKLSEIIIDRLISKGYLDDQKFAEYYCENRFVKKGISRKRLRMELIKKGIANDIIEQVLNRRSDKEEALKIIAKKRKKYDDDKLIQYLVRQGFDYQLAQSLVRETD